jgi:PPK2 family polyphosphate:nucleotide phosphotransferase
VIDKIRIEPGHEVHLAKRDPRDTLGLPGKEETKAELSDLVGKLEHLQRRLYAEATRSLLLVVQGIDASGKDGLIRAVFEGVNPQACSVHSFKAPSSTELAHDYLWRVHAVLPERGTVGIFNRSHYEDVIAVRMLELAPEEVWRRRPRHINEFERMLSDEGTTVVKVFLHVSKEEQATRFRERIDDPEKQWKFRSADLDVHARYDEYMAAYEELLAETSTDWAPWHVVPADRNWVKAHVVAELLVRTLERLDPQLPAPEPGIEKLRID